MLLQADSHSHSEEALGALGLGWSRCEVHIEGRRFLRFELLK